MLTNPNLLTANNQPPTSNRYDVAIIGGGLAGLTLAIQCADKGYGVILFEKEQYPFHKVCGEYISMESWSFLERLGLPLSEWNLPLITKFQTSDIAGRLYDFNLPLGGFGISRYKVDNALYQLALQKKVTIITQCKVSDVKFIDNKFQIETSSGTFYSAIAAGCFGKRSNLDVKMERSFIKQKPNKLNNYIGIKYHIKYPQPDSLIALHNFKNGYCGISKVENNTCCLCYMTTADNLANSGNSIQQMQHDILYKNPRLKEIFSSADFIYDQPLAISQISFNKKLQVEDHILMLGDSAGMIAPLCGNGMSMAIHSAKIAFEVVNDFLERKVMREKMEENYRGHWQNQFAKRLWVGRTVQRLFGNNTSTAIFLKFMKAFPTAASALIRSTHGKPF